MIFLGLNMIFLTHFAAADPRRWRVEMVYRFDIRGLRLNLLPSSKSVHHFPPAALAESKILDSDQRSRILPSHEQGLPSRAPDP